MENVDIAVNRTVSFAIRHTTRLALMAKHDNYDTETSLNVSLCCFEPMSLIESRCSRHTYASICSEIERQ